MSVAYIGLGSNLGKREDNLQAALKKIRKAGIKVLKTSSFMETKPYGIVDQPFFINAVAKIETTLPPGILIKKLLSIETEMGRERRRHWGERNIDLDLLLYDDLVITEPDLIVPHPDMQNRVFVLAPLVEIAADAIHPVYGVPMSVLLKKLMSGDEANELLR